MGQDRRQPGVLRGILPGGEYGMRWRHAHRESALPGGKLHLPRVRNLRSGKALRAPQDPIYQGVTSYAAGPRHSTTNVALSTTFSSSLTYTRIEAP